MCMRMKKKSAGGGMTGRSVNMKQKVVNGVALATAFPLPDDFFPIEELTPLQKQDFITIAEEAFNKLISSSLRHNGAVKWKPLLTKQGVEICYENKSKQSAKPRSSSKCNLNRTNSEMLRTSDGSNSSSSTATESNDAMLVNNQLGVVSACGFSTCEGTLEEIAKVFRGDTTEQIRAWAKNLSGDIIDAMHLYTLRERSEKTKHLNYIGIKWTAGASPTRLYSDRDFVYVECQSEFVDADGTRGWARSMQSIPLAGCPPLTQFGIVRAEFFNSGYVFRETTTPGLVHCSQLIKWNPHGNMPKWILKAGMIRRLSGVNMTDKFLKNRKLSQCTYLTKQQLVPKKHRKCCTICEYKFSILSRKHGCRLCGEVICSNCNKTWRVNVPKVGVFNVRICTRCFIDMRKGENDSSFCVL